MNYIEPPSQWDKEVDKALEAYVREIEAQMKERPLQPQLGEWFRLDDLVRREIYQLICILRDETQCQTVHARCLAALKKLEAL